MGTEATAAPPAARSPRADPKRQGGLEARITTAVLAVLPGAMVAWFGFHAGGYYPGTVAFGCLIALQLLILRILLAERAFDGFTPAVAVVGLALTAFAGWVLASGAWTDAQDRSLLDFDRALLYASVFVGFGIVARQRNQIPWMVRGIVVAIIAVCTAGLVSWVLPRVLPTHPGRFNDRLSYPITYWNGLGILAAIGVLMALGLSSSKTERAPVRIAAAAAVPILATTIFFTFSRGAMLALFFGAIAFLATAGWRATLASALAVLPPTAVAVVVAYQADHLATLDPSKPAPISEGKHVAVVVALCVVAAALLRLLALGADRRLERLAIPAGVRRARWPIAGASALAVVLVAIAVGVPGWVGDQWHGFLHNPPFNGADQRQRLTNASSSGRLDHWRVALDMNSAAPLNGHGAGTFQFDWTRERHSTLFVREAHSLYIEALGEVGIVGLVLLLVAIVGILVGLARRARGPNRALYAALFAGGVAWALHAGIDWDWEMPGVTAWLFAAGGAALAARARPGADRGADSRARVPLAIALAVAAVTPGIVTFSQGHLDKANKDFLRGDCNGASSEARSSINTLAVRPEPYQLLGYCDMLEGRPAAAVGALEKAVEQQPDNWEFHYSLALADALAGRDPMPQSRQAVRLNPREPLATNAVKAFRRAKPRSWTVTSERLRDDAITSGQLTFK